MLLKATIDPLTRAIILDSYHTLAIEKDFKVSGIKFTVPNSVGIDISFLLSNSAIRIMYKTPAKTGYYSPTDFAIDNTTVSFSWIFDKNVTGAPGIVEFSVCATITNASNVITKEWHSDVSKIRIGRTIHTNVEQPTTQEKDEIARLAGLVQKIYPSNTGTDGQVLTKVGDGAQWKSSIVDVTPATNSGTKVATITVGETSTDIYATVDSTALNAALVGVYGE